MIPSRIPYLVFPLIAGIFLLTRNPHVSFGDSLGFLVFACEGFDLDTNATSHFLYNNLNHLALRIFSGADPIAVLTLFSVCCALAALVQVFRAALALTGNPAAAALSAVSLGLGFTFWRQAVIIEVYALNSLWVATILLHMVRGWQEDARDPALLVSLLLGLALLTHIQNLLLLPAYALFLYVRPRPRRLHTWAGPVLLLAISAVLVILPLALHTHGLRAVFFEDQYQEAVLGIDWAQLPRGFLRSLAYLLYNYHLFLPFLVHGALLAWRSHRRLFALLATAGLPFWLFAMRYDVSDNYVFFLTPYLVLSLLAAYSFAHWRRRFSGFTVSWVPPAAVLIAPLVYCTVLQGALLAPSLQARDQQEAYKGGPKYYLWPGQAQSADPLGLAQAIYAQHGKELPEQWRWFDRYENALQYLKVRGEIPAH